MRIHTDTLSPMHVINALQAEKQAGRIAHEVTIKKIRKHGSRARARGIEVQLTASAPGGGRRVGNSGSYGPMTDGTYAATFDEWGWLLAALFKRDPAMIVGSPTMPDYESAEHFHAVTAWTYDPEHLIAEIAAEGGDPWPWIVTIAGGRIGRRGYGRAMVPDRYTSARAQAEAIRKYQEGAKTGNDSLKFSPRTPEWIREFAHLTPATTEGN